jgi:integrase
MQWKVRNVVEDAGSFYVRLYEGKKRRKIKLGRCDEFPTKTALERAAEEIRTKHHVAVSGRTITLSQFIKFFYLPIAKQHVRAITYSGYETIYRVHIQPQKIANLKLWEFSTVEVQALLHAIAASRDLTKMTLKHIKATLSGIFRHAIQIGFYRGANPVHEAQLPWKARPSSDTEAYSLEDIRLTLPHLPLPLRAAFAVASFAGLRRSEIQGLEWEDIKEDRLTVRRSVVAGETNAPKSKASRSWVPIVPPLAAILEEYRKASGGEGRLFPMSLGNAGVSLKAAMEAAGVKYAAWHAARRGLASNAYELGADDLTVQRILRHGSVQVTRSSYIKLRDARVDSAMAKLSDRYGNGTDEIEQTR